VRNKTLFFATLNFLLVFVLADRSFQCVLVLPALLGISSGAVLVPISGRRNFVLESSESALLVEHKGSSERKDWCDVGGFVRQDGCHQEIVLFFRGSLFTLTLGFPFLFQSLIFVVLSLLLLGCDSVSLHLNLDILLLVRQENIHAHAHIALSLLQCEVVVN